MATSRNLSWQFLRNLGNSRQLLVAVRGSPWHSVAVKRERCKKIPCYIWGVGTFRFPFYPRLWLLKLEVEESRHKISLVGPPPVLFGHSLKKNSKGVKNCVFLPEKHLSFVKKKGYRFWGHPSPLYRQKILAKKWLRIWGVPPSPLQTKPAKWYLMSLHI